MVISSLRQTSPEHITVCLSDGGEIRTTLGVVTELRLFAGRELDSEALNLLQRQSGLALAREKALQLVSQRQMSRRELSKKLREKGFDPETADYCVDWVTERGLLNEESYAAAVVRHYAAKGYGESRIRQELQRRGLPRELWEEALAAMPEDPSKLDRLIAQRLHDPSNRDEVRKLTSALFRRGFGMEEIRSALKRFQTSLEDE